MKKQGSAAPLLFHALCTRMTAISFDTDEFFSATPSFNPGALRFPGLNRIAQLIVLQALTGGVSGAIRMLLDDGWTCRVKQRVPPFFAH
jgi:hypothetical protein